MCQISSWTKRISGILLVKEVVLPGKVGCQKKNDTPFTIVVNSGPLSGRAVGAAGLTLEITPHKSVTFAVLYFLVFFIVAVFHRS